MSKLSQVLYLCGILLLAFLAAMPYWPTIKEEAKNIYSTWQAIRNPDSQKADAQEAAEPNEGDRGERLVAQPKTVDELTLTTKEKSDPENLDPFLAEARQRAKNDPQAAMQWLQEQSTGAERLRGMLEVVALWAAKDSESALLWLESNAQGLARLETLNSGVELWAGRAPKAAANWIDGMANDGSKVTAAKSLVSTWVKSNPTEAAEWVVGLPNDSIRDEAASALALSWMEFDPVSASAWAGKESKDTNNDQLYIQVIGKYAQIAPAEAENFMRMTPVEDPSTYTSYLEGFVKARAAHDPVATAEWLQSLPPNDRLKQPQNTTRLMEVWTKTDSVAASAWLSDQAPGPERDAAIVGFAETIQGFEPKAATAWANTISDAEQRSEQLSKSIQSWAKAQPKDALEWVVDSELEPALQERLVREIGY